MKVPLLAWVRRHPRLALASALLLAVAATLAGLPLYAEYQWRAAQADLREDRFEEARRRLRVCSFVYPRSVRVGLAAARASRLCGDLSEAEARLSAVSKLQGGASEATQLEYLLLRAQTGEVDEVADALFELVMNQHPESALILETMARSHMHHLRYGPAFICLNRWADLEPDSAKPYHWRGWVLERMNRPKVAQVDYAKALEIDPELVPVRLRLAEMYLEDSNPQKAGPILDRLHKQYPDRADVAARLGQCRFSQGRRDEARRLLEFAQEQMPNDPALLLHLAKIDMLDGNAKAAEPRIRKVLANDSGDTEAWHLLISCLNQQGRREETEKAVQAYEKYKVVLERANKLLREIAERGKRDPESAYEVGRTLLELNQERLGVHWLYEALNFNPNHTAAHQALAEFHERKGNMDKAAAHRQRVSRQ